jgi:hypothetical protein
MKWKQITVIITESLITCRALELPKKLVNQCVSHFIIVHEVYVYSELWTTYMYTVKSNTVENCLQNLFRTLTWCRSTKLSLLFFKEDVLKGQQQYVLTCHSFRLKNIFLSWKRWIFKSQSAFNTYSNFYLVFKKGKVFLVY